MQTQSFLNINKNDRNYILLIFVIALVFRTVPEVIAYPYPIGYDVLNYYIPNNKNFESNWNVISHQFPFYLLILHMITVLTLLDPELIVRIAGILVFGIFSVSVYQISRKLLSLPILSSFFVALFVIFQVSVLRTSWDLHRDMFAITAFLFAFAFGLNGKNMSVRTFILVTAACIVSVLADRMIGALLTSSLVIYSAATKNKKCMLLTVTIALIYMIALLQGSGEIVHNLLIFGGNTSSISSYSPANLLILFTVTNFFLIPTGIIGFLKTGYISLKIPLILSLILSFSWVLTPFSSGILPDRWTFIFSIFLSIFAGYGFVMLINAACRSLQHKEILLFSCLTPFIIMGLFFATSSNEMALSVYAPIHEFVGQFTPMTMQYNSISITESKSISNAIDWINHNTPVASTIFGNKHWRGWMVLELKNRTYVYFTDLAKLVSLSSPEKYWLTRSNESLSSTKNISKVYSNGIFSVYRSKAR